MIIVGYQGIGKSTVCKNNIINGKIPVDLESSCFWCNREDGTRFRPDGWEKIYANIAYNLSKQGFIVFMSSHKSVRDALCDDKFNDVDKYIICPSVDIKDKWIERLKNRYEESNLKKDYAAYMNALDKYEENICDMISESERGFKVEIINSTKYNLATIIRQAINPIE